MTTMTTTNNDEAAVNVDDMLAQWTQQGQSIAGAIKAERDTLVQRVERDMLRIDALNQKLGDVRLRLGLPTDTDETPPTAPPPVLPNGHGPIVKMSRTAQRLVPVIRRRPAAAPTAPIVEPLHADQFASSTEVITAILAREPGLSTAELVERCMPLRPAVTRGSWTTMVYHMQNRGMLQSTGKGTARRWSLPVAAVAPKVEEKGAA